MFSDYLYNYKNCFLKRHNYKCIYKTYLKEIHSISDKESLRERFKKAYEIALRFSPLERVYIHQPMKTHAYITLIESSNTLPLYYVYHTFLQSLYNYRTTGNRNILFDSEIYYMYCVYNAIPLKEKVFEETQQFYFETTQSPGVIFLYIQREKAISNRTLTTIPALYEIRHHFQTMIQKDIHTTYSIAKEIDAYESFLTAFEWYMHQFDSVYTMYIQDANDIPKDAPLITIVAEGIRNCNISLTKLIHDGVSAFMTKNRELFNKLYDIIVYKAYEEQFLKTMYEYVEYECRKNAFSITLYKDMLFYLQNLFGKEKIRHFWNLYESLKQSYEPFVYDSVSIVPMKMNWYMNSHNDNISIPDEWKHIIHSHWHLKKTWCSVCINKTTHLTIPFSVACLLKQSLRHDICQNA